MKTCAAVVLAVVLGALVGGPPAFAVFPGVDGLVVYTMNGDLFTTAAGVPRHRLTFNGRSSQARWSPDGFRLAYVLRSLPGVQPPVEDLAIMRADGSGSHRVTFAHHVRNPAWSPDGGSVVFADAVAGHSDLFRVSVRGGTAARLTHAGSLGCDVDHPSWRRSLIVYHVRCAADRDEIRILDLTSGRNRLVFSADHSLGESLSWPDFTRDLRVLFLACLQSDPICFNTENVHVVARDGSGLQSLTDSGGAEGDPLYRNPVPSPDGTTYVVVESEPSSGGGALWSISGPQGVVVSGATPLGEPDWQRVLTPT